MTMLSINDPDFSIKDAMRVKSQRESRPKGKDDWNSGYVHGVLFNLLHQDADEIFSDVSMTDTWEMTLERRDHIYEMHFDAQDGCYYIREVCAKCCTEWTAIDDGIDLLAYIGKREGIKA